MRLSAFTFRRLTRAAFTSAFALALVVLSLASGFTETALANTKTRVALVIGNGNYKFAPKLDNPTFDAKAVAAALQRLGFIVTEGYDLSGPQMRTTLREFYDSLPDSNAALVYYAGHGVSVDDENYLLPVDIQIKSPSDLDLNAISISLILRQLHREERVNVIILDACRDNPFASDLSRAKSRAVVGDRGLSPLGGELARGSLIAFASDPKSTALDGPLGEHSPFTKALLRHIEDPAVSIDTVMSRVRSEVWDETKGQQLPWVNTSIIGEFGLNREVSAHEPAVVAPPVVAASPVPATDSHAQENLLWESAQHSNLAGDYRAYLDAYPSGVFAQMAKNRIALLERPAPPPVLPAPAAPGPTPAVLAPGPTPAVVAPGPTPAIVAPGPSPAVGAPEIGSEATERSLALDLAARKAVQQRLETLGAKVGAIDGEFAEQTRGSIKDWQRKHGFEPSGWLGPLQLAALKTETEEQYQKLLKEQQSVHPPSGPTLAPVAARPLDAPKRWPRARLERPPKRKPRLARSPTRGIRANCRPPKARAKPATLIRNDVERPGRQESSSPAPAPAPAFNAPEEAGPCQPHMHTVASPDPRGYRCVLDGY